MIIYKGYGTLPDGNQGALLGVALTPADFMRAYADGDEIYLPISDFFTDHNECSGFHIRFGMSDDELTLNAIERGQLNQHTKFEIEEDTS